MTIIKKFEPEKEKKESIWKTKRFVVVIGFFLLGLILAEIWVANAIANYGEKFENIQRLQRTLEQENQLLENELEKESSLQNISSSSAALGLIEPKSVKYIR